MKFIRKKRKYPINQKRVVKSQKSGQGVGYIYLLSNPAFHLSDSTPIYKLGYTLRLPKDRAWELYDEMTGVPAKFKVEYSFRVPPKFAEKIETLAHRKLKQFRVNQYREFFACHITICIKAIEESKAELTIKKKSKKIKFI